MPNDSALVASALFGVLGLGIASQVFTNRRGRLLWALVGIIIAVMGLAAMLVK